MDIDLIENGFSIVSLNWFKVLWERNILDKHKILNIYALEERRCDFVGLITTNGVSWFLVMQIST